MMSTDYYILSRWTMIMITSMTGITDGYYYFECGFSTRCNAGSCIANTDPDTRALKPFVCDCSGLDGYSYDCTGRIVFACLNCVNETTVSGDDCVGALHPAYIEGHTDWCHCRETHYGPQCQYSRVTHTCGLSMDIHIEPHLPFEGSMTMIGSNNREGPSCSLDVVDSNTLGMHYQKIGFLYAGNIDGCPDPEMILDALGLPIIFRVRVLIQNEEDFHPNTIQVLTFDCEIKDTGEIIYNPPEIPLQIDGPQNEQLSIIDRPRQWSYGRDGVTVTIAMLSMPGGGHYSSFQAQLVITDAFDDFSLKTLLLSNYDMTMPDLFTGERFVYPIIFNWCVRRYMPGEVQVLHILFKQAWRRRQVTSLNIHVYVLPNLHPRPLYFFYEICMGTCHVVSVCDVIDDVYPQSTLLEYVSGTIGTD